MAELDGGGWTLVWQHSYMDDLPLNLSIDKCANGNGIQPAPENRHAIGLTFDKASPYHYKANCDTHKGSFTNLGDCRWENCILP